MKNSHNKIRCWRVHEVLKICPRIRFRWQSVSSWKWTFWPKLSLEKRKSVKPNRPKNQFLKISQTVPTCQTPKFSQAAWIENFKKLSKLILFQEAIKLPHNVGSYTQGRTAGDFLSGRTRKSSGEPPTENPLLPHLTGSWSYSLLSCQSNIVG